MATLKHLSSGAEHTLTARYVVGRAPACTLRLDDPQVSGVHAELRWDGDHWVVQDLGSSNGTFHNGVRMSGGERARLLRGSELAFGNSEERFGLVELGPPPLMAVTAGRPPVVAQANLLCLPSDDEPALTIYEVQSGQWVVEEGDQSRPLTDQAVVMAGGCSWTVFLPTASIRTRNAAVDMMLVEGIRLVFRLSRDEATVSIQVQHGAEEQTLEPRAHASLLLVLARARLDDAREEQGLPEFERGWLHREELMERLSIDSQLLNLWVYRARQQLSQAGVRDAARIIERRAGAQQLRLGISRVTIGSG